MATKEEKKQKRETIFLKHSTSEGVGAVFIGEASLRQLRWEDIALCWTTGCVFPLCRYKTKTLLPSCLREISRGSGKKD